MMLNRVQNTLKNAAALSDEGAVLVGVSGGPDSLCLVNILNRLGYLIIIGHFDHRLRAESQEEAHFVQQYADSLGMAFVSGVQDTTAFAASNKFSIEEAARILRYRFLFEQARLLGAQAVAVGHNADDQVETVIMHLLRGSGMDGLTGMQTAAIPNTWSEEIVLLRPLLPIWRHEILKYCSRQNIQYLLDSSNQELTFFRNRLRHELIPALDDYLPGAAGRIWRMADTLQSDQEIVERVVDSAWEKCLVVQGAGYIALDRLKFQNQSLGIKRRLVRSAVKVLRSNLRDLNYEQIERTLRFFDRPPKSGQADFGFGLRLFLENDRFYIASSEGDLPDDLWPQLGENQSLTMPVPGRLELENGWIMSVDIVEDLVFAREQAVLEEDPFNALISIDRQVTGLTLRSRRTGDRFAPSGMGGKTTKIKDFMIDKKIPRRARAKWPLVCMDGEISWIPGYRTAESFRFAPENTLFIHLRLRCFAEDKQGPDNAS
ncbi:MAG: tRNA lysidine(34) synthetase TilS [Chloroflexota bacterium]